MTKEVTSIVDEAQVMALVKELGRRGWLQHVDLTEAGTYAEGEETDLRKMAGFLLTAIDQINPELRDAGLDYIRTVLEEVVTAEVPNPINLKAGTGLLMEWGNIDHRVKFDWD